MIVVVMGNLPCMGRNLVVSAADDHLNVRTSRQGMKDQRMAAPGPLPTADSVSRTFALACCSKGHSKAADVQLASRGPSSRQGQPPLLFEVPQHVQAVQQRPVELLLEGPLQPDAKQMGLLHIDEWLYDRAQLLAKAAHGATDSSDCRQNVRRGRDHSAGQLIFLLRNTEPFARLVQ